MTVSDYHRGEMNIADQEATWKSFLTFSLWGGLILALILGHAILAIAIGMHWLISLSLMVIAGLVAGVVMRMGGAWFATVGGLAALGIFVQIIIKIAQALL